ncbi:hypothetical protein JQ596_21825 [Bradyrhizobium manausense]|uniref:hypothetical protein n=1 Tax=Bradyrhizobium TaxID=374 RepID=UPI001BA918FA|nr:MULTISPECIES: hypothetical protein [Bradyrhizobium]MBR0828179.1 hypothetical protein [Bradyrhizobium manausense]UVO25222.1 hypothetical protein KUF59_21630 [Bradyrhizobium arachidis]
MAAFAVAAYVAAAAYFHASYVDPRPKGRIVVQLLPPFQHEAGHAFSGQGRPGEYAAVTPFADEPSEEGPSRTAIYEDGRMLGGGHSTFRDIRDLGQGRFLYLKGRPVYFSSTDNSDPNTNGRKYWIAVP